jgi:hypothetical protein
MDIDGERDKSSIHAKKIKSLVEGTTCVHYYVFDGSYLSVCYHFDKHQQASTVVCIWVGSYAVECTPSLRSTVSSVKDHIASVTLLLKLIW